MLLLLQLLSYLVSDKGSYPSGVRQELNKELLSSYCLLRSTEAAVCSAASVALPSAITILEKKAQLDRQLAGCCGSRNRNSVEMYPRVLLSNVPGTCKHCAMDAQIALSFTLSSRVVSSHTSFCALPNYTLNQGLADRVIYALTIASCTDSAR